MRSLITLIIMPMLLQACITKEVVRTVEKPVPVYVTVHPEKPDPLTLEELSWDWLPELSLFALTPEEFDKYKNNLLETDLYINLLQEGWSYYEKAGTEVKTE